MVHPMMYEILDISLQAITIQHTERCLEGGKQSRQAELPLLLDSHITSAQGKNTNRALYKSGKMKA